jgi:hypothetical protein
LTNLPVYTFGAEAGIVSKGITQAIEDLGNTRPQRGQPALVFLFVFVSLCHRYSELVITANNTSVLPEIRFEETPGYGGTIQVGEPERVPRI